MGLRLSFFLLVTTLLALAGHVYLYRRLVRDTGSSQRWRRAGLLALGLVFTAMPFGRLLSRSVEGPLSAALASFGWAWMAVAVYLVLSLAALGGLQRARAWLQRRRAPSPPAPVSAERREFLAQVTAGSAVALTAGFTGYGAYRAFSPPVVNEVQVRLRGLPRALDGLTLLQLSDIHVAPLVQRRFMDAVVQQCNGLRPDLVVVTGDLVDGSVRELAPHVAALQNLRTRYGTYFCTGNHEYYSGDVAWAQALERMGIGVLRNRHVTVGQEKDSLDLVGVDDWSQDYDLERAVAGRDPERAAVLLAHQPKGWQEAAAKGIGLQLSGHTHGGQFFPFTLAVSAIWQYPAGLFHEGDSHLYVSRGTGFWGPPVRVGAPPEIVKVTLLA
ncbi:metallophosphoesterase [Aggregicoccus sp. 17bor-14]|uniref:metallophosphoesterase n=1 Tax=Myxococcaceae TaxID=31 RepID=UPI00129CBE22|nr:MULTISPECIES: metallophosphoesterase [Myxococcaceae]MBF5042993.1 metallophosphoesterase [Simulacricoccus sp. 17bor-14]MRI88758.1 metallophosphoesterase [Aggregicoccus sp. 17bor-14]